MNLSLKSNYYINSFFWGVANKLITAIINFFSVPLLMNYFGVKSFGLFSIVMSLNVFINLLDLGLNTGSIKYYSNWKEAKEFAKIDKVVSTSLTIYTILGFVNIIVFSIISIFPEVFFKIDNTQIGELKVSLWILALFSIPSWLSSVYYQLLVAYEKINVAHRIIIAVQFFKLLAIGLTLFFKLSFISFFFMYTLGTGMLFLLYFLSAKYYKMISGFKLGFYFSDFKEVLGYSVGIFCYSIFAVIATQSRPIILGMFGSDPTVAVSEYKILEAFPLFIISLGGLISSIVLPKSSKIIHNKDTVGKEKMAYTGTLYSSILCCLLCFPVILNAKDILNCYVGSTFTYLENGLIFWCITVLIFLHSSPCNSLILATGKIKLLVFTTFISCLLSITINIFFISQLGLWSTLVGYFVYILFQMLFQYLIFYPRILNIKPIKVFFSFIKPVLIATTITIVIKLFFHLSFSFMNEKFSIAAVILLKSVVFYLAYFLLLVLFKMVSVKTIKSLK